MAPEKRFDAAIQELWPGATGAELAALFDHRVTIPTISNWRAGRRGVPLWALDKLRQRIAERSAAALHHLDNAKAGPGLKAGARNLAVYLARRA